ncbi:MAG: diphthamide biosynthesis enzyme Dph2 [Candidatus Methanoplasma sp.]|jgi:2-(3-amino-3-carboxypropyl)histidine synthase|nr:diphthamide biosynthesis enzyme Dph2 [Candidatus Methanoplasma sp.]
MFNLEIEKTIKWIRDGGYTSVALQLPEGLKVRAAELSDSIRQETGADVIILGYPCYGACDLFTDYRKYASALVHFGHSPMPSLGPDKDILFVEARASPDISAAVVSAAEELPDRVGILATVQYVGLIEDAKKILENAGKTVIVGKGDVRIFHPGQVLGCNFSSATVAEKDVDAFLYLGEGDFHPLAAAFGTSKKVVVLNPITGEIRSVDDIRDRILRKRFATIEKAKSAESFLVIICGKIGQNRTAEANTIAKKITDSGKRVYKIVADEITPDSLLPYRVDAYVNTACPRIAMDDSARYSKPMLTIPETEIVLGLREWEDYKFDSI